eukprot:TRINITY_DN104_c0_g1_i2.p1 TRINITY_DN104_c0_g1~~TRINITY_DN104_c0_g1_i2.p1  ORF type:complete len:171 (+),score=42.28 TRINITY_DN104_c0_g1_i2:106-618(+)
MAETMKKYNLTSKQVKAMIKTYKSSCTKDGKMQRAGFLKLLDGIISPILAEKMFDSFDKDRSGTIDVKEFLTMMGVAQGGTTEQKLEATFEVYDKNGDGTLSRDEIKDMVLTVVKTKRGAVDAKSLEAIDRTVATVFTVVDTDHNGVLDKAEFIKGFSEHPEVCGFFKQF